MLVAQRSWRFFELDLSGRTFNLINEVDHRSRECFFTFVLELIEKMALLPFVRSFPEELLSLGIHLRRLRTMGGRLQRWNNFLQQFLAPTLRCDRILATLIVVVVFGEADGGISRRGHGWGAVKRSVVGTWTRREQQLLGCARYERERLAIIVRALGMVMLDQIVRIRGARSGGRQGGRDWSLELRGTSVLRNEVSSGCCVAYMVRIPRNHIAGHRRIRNCTNLGVVQ